MHTHTYREAHTAVGHTDTLSCRSFDMSSIHLASSGDETWNHSLYFVCRQLHDGVIGLSLLVGERERENGSLYWNTKRQRHGWHQSDHRPVFFFVLATAKLERKSVDTLVQQRAVCVSVCARVGGQYSAAVEGHDRNRWAQKRQTYKHRDINTQSTETSTKQVSALGCMWEEVLNTFQFHIIINANYTITFDIFSRTLCRSNKDKRNILYLF